MKAKILIVVACLSLVSTVANPAGPMRVIRVNLECGNADDDAVGRTVCFSLREKIRASRGFELVDKKDAENSPLGFGVHIVSVNTTVAYGEQTAMAVAFTIPEPSPKLDSFLTQYIFVGRVEKANELASDILGHIDEESSFLRNISN